MKIIAKKDIQVNGIYYNKGNEIPVQSKEQLVKLNEKGYIEPLTPKEIQDWELRPIKNSFNKKEE